jgi:hypothetical protein
MVPGGSASLTPAGHRPPVRFWHLGGRGAHHSTSWRDPDSHRGPPGYEPGVVLLHYPAVVPENPPSGAERSSPRLLPIVTSSIHGHKCQPPHGTEGPGVGWKLSSTVALRASQTDSRLHAASRPPASSNPRTDPWVPSRNA